MAATDPRTMLEVRNLHKSFGGVRATDDFSIAVTPNEIHAIIGPNGAGKTTLIAQLSGALQPDSGTIQFNGRDITRVPPHRRSHMGLARSFQITSIFLDMTAIDNVALAVQAHAGHSFHFWKPAAADTRLTDPAQAALERVGLKERADTLAANLAHGEQRQLEIAMAIATNPVLLLLDEPMAGMGTDESQRMVEIIRELKQQHTILLVEHDMDAVFALADTITVMVYGKAIASGNPDEIRGNQQVIEAYLGEETATGLDGEPWDPEKSGARKDG